MATKNIITVRKMQRGGDGKWFAYRGRRFASREAAIAFADAFARSQRAAGVIGTRIVAVDRDGALVGAWNVNRGDVPSDRANATTFAD